MWLLVLLSCSEYALDPKGEPPEEGVPDIAISPTTLSFEAGGLPCEESDEVRISNEGELTLHIDQLVVTGDSGFYVLNVTADIASGESLQVPVTLQASAEGSYRATLTVYSNDPDEGEAPVDLQAVASATAPMVDTFVQQQSDIDVLWVIDNSSSMAEEQYRLSVGIMSFFSYFETLQMDYHMGVVTSDIVTPTMAGRLQGSPAYITTTTTDAAVELAEAINVGEDDMGNESGLAAVEMALTEPVLSAENAGFYRPDAHLAIIFLSDEPEQSEQEALHYIEFLASLKPDAQYLHPAAIVGDETLGCSSTCDDVAQTAQPGDKYIAAVRAFEGTVESICTCDIATSLNTIGYNSTVWLRTFVLTNTPVDTTAITVTVDGVTSTDWSYDAAENSVVFNTPPVEGASVAVGYEVVSTCEG